MSINNIQTTPPKQTNTIRSMTEEEKLSIAVGLQKYHGVFKKFWQISTILFSEGVSTAAVFGNSAGGVAMMQINPHFWERQTPTQRLWIICHECLHAILDHFSRGRLLEHQSLANKMMDVVINHTTVEKFGFKRSEIDPDNVYCWMDKFFAPEENIPSGQNFEFYYHEMLKKGNWDNGDLLDDHRMMTEEEFEEFIKKMNKDLSPQEKQFLKDWLMGQNAPADGQGTGNADNLWSFGDIGYVKKKKKWESVIKKWVVKAVGIQEKPKEQWVFEDRRMALLSKEMSLPFTRDDEDIFKKKEKIDLFFFLDTSGSCFSFGERFYKAARSIPTDKFNIHLFNFDTFVYDVDIEKAEVKGGGGTLFNIIEDKIQSIVKRDEINYSKISVWILTDGYGNEVKPQVPETWHWFLTDGSTDSYIDKKSHKYKLDDYE